MLLNFTCWCEKWEKNLLCFTGWFGRLLGGEYFEKYEMWSLHIAVHTSSWLPTVPVENTELRQQTPPTPPPHPQCWSFPDYLSKVAGCACFSSSCFSSSSLHYHVKLPIRGHQGTRTLPFLSASPGPVQSGGAARIYRNTESRGLWGS